MFSHVMIGANDIEASRKFYDAVMQELGAKSGIQNKLKGIMRIKQAKKNKFKTNVDKTFKKISLFELQNSPKFLNFRVRA